MFKVKTFGTLLPYCTVKQRRIPHKYLHCSDNARYYNSDLCQRSRHPLLRWYSESILMCCISCMFSCDVWSISDRLTPPSSSVFVAFIPLHKFTHSLSTLRFNIIFTFLSPMLSLFWGLWNLSFVYSFHLPCTCYLFCSSHAVFTKRDFHIAKLKYRYPFCV